MTHEEHWRKLRSIADTVARECPPLPTDTVRDLILVGELKIALEILLDNVAESPVQPSAALRVELDDLARSLGITPQP